MSSRCSAGVTARAVDTPEECSCSERRLRAPTNVRADSGGIGVRKRVGVLQPMLLSRAACIVKTVVEGRELISRNGTRCDSCLELPSTFKPAGRVVTNQLDNDMLPVRGVNGATKVRVRLVLAEVGGGSGGGKGTTACTNNSASSTSDISWSSRRGEAISVARPHTEELVNELGVFRKRANTK